MKKLIYIIGMIMMSVLVFGIETYIPPISTMPVTQESLYNPTTIVNNTNNFAPVTIVNNTNNNTFSPTIVMNVTNNISNYITSINNITNNITNNVTNNFFAGWLTTITNITNEVTNIINITNNITNNVTIAITQDYNITIENNVSTNLTLNIFNITQIYNNTYYYNDTYILSQLDLKLNITDQRYNDTGYCNGLVGNLTFRNITNNYQNSSDTESSTTNITYQQKVRLTTNNLTTGTYRIGYSMEGKSDSLTYDFMARVQINDAVTIAEFNHENNDAQTYNSYSGFYYYTGSGVLNIDLDYTTENSISTSYIRRARLEIWRTE